MKQIIDIFFHRHNATIFLLLTIILFGSMAYVKTAKEMNPDIKIPYLFVTSTLRGVSPLDGERLILRPLESALRSVEGLKHFSAFSVDGRVQVMLEFEAGFDTDRAKDLVKDKIDSTISELPSEATRPSVHEINLSTLPVLNIGISGETPYRTLVEISKILKRKIEEVKGVLSVETPGVKEEVTEIIIKPSNIIAYGISPHEIIQLMLKNNVVISSGKISKKTGEYSLRVPGLIESAEDVAAMPIRTNQNGAIVTLGDIATVKMTYADPVTMARINGQDCVVLEVSKRIGVNLINTIEKVKKEIDKIRPFYPKDINFIYSQDQSSEIKDMLSELQNSVILAVLLVIIVSFFFMGKNASIIVSFAIPISFLMGILGIYLLGYTFNIVVLFSLIMAIGMLVDDTIVIVECADRKMSSGMSTKDAFYGASYEMFWPVVTSTFTKIAVFLPLLSWPGIIGEFMSYMPITLLLLLVSSLIVSLLFVPVIATKLNLSYDKTPEEMKKIKAIENVEKDNISGMTKGYIYLLEYAIDHPKKIISISTLVLLLGTAGFFKFGPGMKFFPKVNESNISVTVRARGSFSMEERETIVKNIESKLLNFKSFKVLYTKFGDFSSKASSTSPPDKIGVINIELVDWHKRKKSYEIASDIRKKIVNIPGVIIEVSERGSGPSSSKAIQIDLVAQDLAKLKKNADSIVDFMNNTAGFVDPMNTVSAPQNQFFVKIDRKKAMLYGLDLLSIGSIVEMVGSGAMIGKYRVSSSDDEIKIIARFPPEDRTLNFLKNAFVISATGKSFPISEFITIKPEQRINRINRAHGGRVVSVSSDVDRRFLVEGRLKLLQGFISKNLDSGINIFFKGEKENLDESQSFLLRAFLLAIFLMMVVMIYEFNNFYRMFVVLSAVFLSTSCVFLGLFVIYYPFGLVMGGVGIISLAGIIVNNNILLIDAYQHNITSHSNRESIIKAAVSRFRAILVTAVSTGVGLIPMIARVTIDFFNMRILYDSPSSQYWFDLSVTIVGGLVFATSLTLFFTPSLLSLKESK